MPRSSRMVQADQAPGRKARLVADLYPDTFQIVVLAATVASKLHRRSRRQGKRIALPPREKRGIRIFLVAGLSITRSLPCDLELSPVRERISDWPLINGDVDAPFGVRAPGDPSILHLIRRRRRQGRPQSPRPPR